MNYLFNPDNWEWLWTENNARFLLEGFLINLQIAAISMVFALAIGLLLSLLSLTTVTPVRLVAKGWVDLFRNLPLIFLILYLALSLPESIKQGWQDNAPGFLPEVLRGQLVLAGILGLVLYNSAVLAEIMRAGILSLDSGQREAATALGLSYRDQMRHVILPQGLRRMVPATVSQLITLNKATTLVSIIGIQEVMRHARIVSATSGSPFVGTGVEAPLLQVFLAVGIMFVIVNLTLSRLSRRLELRERRLTGVQVEKVEGLEDQLALQTALPNEG